MRNDNFSANSMKWNAIAACYIDDRHWTEQGVNAIAPPHYNKGVNVLYKDTSVRWVARPTTPLPAGLGFGLRDLNNAYPSTTLISANTQPGWPDSMYNPGSPGGNVLDFLNFWPWVNAMYGQK
jgi:hypothetical protein